MAFEILDPFDMETGWTRVYIAPTWRTLCDTAIQIAEDAAQLAAEIDEDEDNEEEDEENSYEEEIKRFPNGRSTIGDPSDYS